MRYLIALAMLMLSPTLSSSPGLAAEIAVVLQRLGAAGSMDVVGGLRASDTPEGAVFKIVVVGFEPGYKGFHLLTEASCDAVRTENGLTLAGDAGGIFDPENTKRHDGPFGDGYLGALPKAEANAKGWVFITIVSPRVQIADLRGRALVLREDNDTYKPGPDGIGGAGHPVACGLVR